MTKALAAPAPEENPFQHLADALIRRARAVGGFLGGRPRAIRDPEDQAKVLAFLAKGGTTTEAAKLWGVTNATISRLATRSEGLLREMADAAQIIAAEKVLKNDGAGIAAALDLATNQPDHRNAPQSLRAAYECAGIIGGKGGVSVHVGDTYNQTLIVPPSEGLSGEAAERLAKARDQFGI